MIKLLKNGLVALITFLFTLLSPISHNISYDASYLQLWELLSSIQLQPEVEDKHIWQFSASGQYTTKSAYEALFIGSIECKPWERI